MREQRLTAGYSAVRGLFTARDLGPKQSIQSDRGPSWVPPGAGPASAVSNAAQGAIVSGRFLPRTKRPRGTTSAARVGFVYLGYRPSFLPQKYPVARFIPSQRLSLNREMTEGSRTSSAGLAAGDFRFPANREKNREISEDNALHARRFRSRRGPGLFASAARGVGTTELGSFCRSALVGRDGAKSCPFD
jgi:hypothetical protein